MKIIKCSYNISYMNDRFQLLFTYLVEVPIINLTIPKIQIKILNTIQIICTHIINQNLVAKSNKIFNLVFSMSNMIRQSVRNAH